MKLFEIQKKLKYEFKFEIVPIQSGSYFNLFNEDADFFHLKYDFKTYDQGKNKLAGFPIRRLEYYKKKFDEMNITYAFVEQHLNKKNSSQSRIVRYTSDSNAVGKTFDKKIVQRKEKKLKEYLSALINGFNPLNGVFFKEDSVWKHPEIMSLLKKICKNNTDSEFIGKTESDFLNKTKKKDKVESIKIDNDSGMRNNRYFFDGEYFKNQIEWKKKLKESKEFFNAYEPWTNDLDTELKNLKGQLSIEELAKHFRRSKGAINSRLKKIY